MESETILMTEKDLLRIRHILSFQKSSDFEDLEVELDRAKIISEDEIPANLVTMNSKVKFINLEDDKEMIVTIVYPQDADFTEGKISVLASLGSALIGLMVGQDINWKFPDGRTKKLRIIEILYQPGALKASKPKEVL